MTSQTGLLLLLSVLRLWCESGAKISTTTVNNEIVLKTKSSYFLTKNRVRGACLGGSFGTTIQKWCSCLSAVHISVHEHEGLFRYLAVGFTGPGWEGHGLESAVSQRRGAHFYQKQ